MTAPARPRRVTRPLAGVPGQPVGRLRRDPSDPAAAGTGSPALADGRGGPPARPVTGWRRRLEESGATQVPAYLWCLLIGLVCDLINGNSQYLHLPVSPDRLFVPLALLLLALDGRRRRLRALPVHWLIAAFVFWIIVSMVWHGNLTDSVALFALADRVLFPMLLFCTAPLFFDTPSRRDLLLRTMTLIGVYLGCTGIIEMINVKLAFPSYIADPSAGMMYGRARGPFLAGDAMGLCSAVCGFAGVLLFFRDRRRVWRVLGLVAITTGLTTTVLSLTRATWVGVGLGFVVGALLIPRLRIWIPIAVAAIAAAIVTALVMIPGLQDTFAERLNDQSSVDDRLGSNSAAISLLQDLPLTGIGWRRFFPDGSEWFRISDDFAMNHVVIEIHNIVLSRAAELGIPAAVVFLTIWATGPLRVALTRVHGDLAGWRALGLAAFVAWFGTGMLGPMAIPFPNYLVWLVAGVATYPFAIADPTPEGLGETEASLNHAGPVFAGAPPNEPA